MTTSRSLPNVTYGGQVPTAGLHDLTKLPDLTTLSDPTQLPNLPQLPLDDEQQRSLPGTDLVARCPWGVCWVASPPSVTFRVCPSCR
ncbi:hypothetical protein [Kutzneria kofuensis]|uniref:hypothetical protein n=1 Tax=Kutzneria kofuensis TaxID=103725 RepID=UPI0031F1873F